MQHRVRNIQVTFCCCVNYPQDNVDQLLVIKHFLCSSQIICLEPFITKARFDPRPDHVEFVKQRVTLEWFYFEFFCLPLSMSFRQCSILVTLSATDTIPLLPNEPSSNFFQLLLPKSCSHSSLLPCIFHTSPTASSLNIPYSKTNKKQSVKFLLFSIT